MLACGDLCCLETVLVAVSTEFKVVVFLLIELTHYLLSLTDANSWQRGLHTILCESRVKFLPQLSLFLLKKPLPCQVCFQQLSIVHVPPKKRNKTSAYTPKTWLLFFSFSWCNLLRAHGLIITFLTLVLNTEALHHRAITHPSHSLFIPGNISSSRSKVPMLVCYVTACFLGLSCTFCP